MRTQKDPKIRKEEFIHAALALFATNGYENVSVRNVLDAVGNRSASPSVFYYYFKSKEDLYHACIEAAAASYLSGWKSEFEKKADSLEDTMFSLAATMEDSLRTYANFLPAEARASNRLFILDVRNQMTASMAKLWGTFLRDNHLCSETECASRGSFLAGGIGELIFQFLMGDVKDEDVLRSAMDAISFFALSAMNVSEKERIRIMKKYKPLRQEAGDGNPGGTD